MGESSPPPLKVPEAGGVVAGHCFPSARLVHQVPTQAEAVAAFRRGWEVCADTHHPMNAAIDSSMKNEKHEFLTSIQPCRAIKIQIDNLMKGLSPDLIVTGNLMFLERDGDCFRVHYMGGMKGEVEGILPRSVNELLFAWRVPEG